MTAGRGNCEGAQSRPNQPVPGTQNQAKGPNPLLATIWPVHSPMRQKESVTV